MSTFEQLARTALLFQTDLGVPDPEVVLRALTAPTILLVAGAEVASSLSGQVAITTAAMLMARSGHRVFIDTPDAPLVGDQPPLQGATLHDSIAAAGGSMIDGVQIALGCALFPADIAFVFGGGSAGIGTRARRTFSVGWTAWAGEVLEWPLRPAVALGPWPMGAMAAATLVACEALKVSGRILTRTSTHPGHFAELFAPAKRIIIRLASEDTPQIAQLGTLDIVSGGAVSHGMLYSLLRLPSISGRARIFEGDVSEPSNRNRNMLLLPELVAHPKLEVFKRLKSGLTFESVQRHFVEADLPQLAERVAVGVDDIPTRWMLAGANVSWMGVGATTHFSALASVHYAYSACAACLHPHDEDLEGPTPTVAPVSFLAGLMVAANLLQDIAGDIRLASSSRFITPLQPQGDWSSPVPPILGCPAHCPASRVRAA
jgi:hypothetical protein